MSGIRLFGSVVRALDFYPDRPGSDPTTGGKFFQLRFIPVLWLSWGLVRDRTLLCQKLLGIVINDDFLEKGVVTT